MKVVQVPFCFYPDSVGGTEVYVKGLAQTLQKIGMVTLISAPGEKREQYEYEGLRFCRFEIGPSIDL